MANEVDKELSRKYCPRFGQIAVEKGFVTAENVKDALSEQLDDDLADKPHRLIGRIFLDKGIMTPRQIDDVLNEVFKWEKAG